MGNYDKNLYNVGLWWSGVEAFTTIVNNVNDSKYNDASWRRYAYWGRTMNTPEWKVNVEETNLNIAAAVISVNGQKPPRGVEGWTTYSGTIPMIGHSFSLTSDDFLKMRSFEPVNGDPTYHQRFSYTTRLTRNIGGMHNRINMFVYQALSSGFITADAQNNGEALQGLVIDLAFKRSHYLHPEVVWSDPNADPIQDMLDAQDKASDESINVTNWMMSKKLIRLLASHPKVTQMIAIKKYPTSTISGQVPLSRKEVLAGLAEYYDIYPIIEVDEKADVQQDGGKKEVRSFNQDVAVLVNPDRFFELQHCRNVYADDQNPNIVKTSFEGGRFTMIVEHFSNPAKITSSMESFVLPVPRNPNNIFLLNTATTEEWGTRDQMLDVLTNGVKTEKDPEAVLVDGEEYRRVRVIAGLNAQGVTTGTNMKLAGVQAKVNALDADATQTLIEYLKTNA